MPEDSEKSLRKRKGYSQKLKKKGGQGEEGRRMRKRGDIKA